MRALSKITAKAVSILLACILAVSASVMLMTGCTSGGSGASSTASGDSGSSDTDSSEANSSDAGDSGADSGDSNIDDSGAEEVEEMYTRSLLARGNNYRLHKVIDKIRSGEDVTVAFIGGSITYGYLAGTEEIFAKRVTDHLNEKYSPTGDNVKFINAGISGTPSMLGLIRAGRDILESDPDLVFIEFAVNDDTSNTEKRAYESLIRKCLKDDNSPAVILLFSVLEGGYTAQDVMSATGFYYSLPEISVKNAIFPEIEAGTMTWADWAGDEAHPNASGHEKYATMINYTIDTLIADEIDDEYTIPEKLKYKTDWSDMTLYDSRNLELTSLGSFVEADVHENFSNGWRYTYGTEANDPLTFSFTGKALFIVYKDTKNSTYGSVDVFIDGEHVRTLNANTDDGWNNPVTELIWDTSETAEHEVEIRMTDDTVGKAFEIMCFGISE